MRRIAEAPGRGAEAGASGASPEADGELLASLGGEPFDALVVGAGGGLGRWSTHHLARSARVRRVFAWSRASSPPELEGVIATRGVDLEEPDTVESAAAALEAAGADLRVVVQAAGLLHDEATGLRPERRLEEVDADHLARVFAVNAFGPLLVARSVAHLLPRRERALWVSLSARVGSIGDNRLGGWYAYRASKAALHQFQRSLAVELARTHPGAVVLALHPGTVDTALSEPFQGGVAREKLFEPEHVARRLLVLADTADREDSGGFFAWDGAPVPW